MNCEIRAEVHTKFRAQARRRGQDTARAAGFKIGKKNSRERDSRCLLLPVRDSIDRPLESPEAELDMLVGSRCGRDGSGIRMVGLGTR